MSHEGTQAIVTAEAQRIHQKADHNAQQASQSFATLENQIKGVDSKVTVLLPSPPPYPGMSQKCYSSLYSTFQDLMQAMVKIALMVQTQEPVVKKILLQTLISRM